MVDGQISNRFPVQLNSLATYDYEDIASGEGISIFYLGEADSSSVMRTNEFYSNDINTRGVSDQTDYTVEITKTFQTLFNKPRTVKGTALVTFNLAVEVGSAATTHSMAYAVATIQHYDGTTTTDLGSQTSDILDQDNEGVKQQVMCLDIALTEKRFKSGEYLKVKIEVYGKYAGNSTKKYCWLGHDPKNRNGEFTDSAEDMTPTIAEAHIPFRIEE